MQEIRSYGCVCGVHTHTQELVKIKYKHDQKVNIVFFFYSWYMYACNNACPLFSPHTPRAHNYYYRR